MHTEPVFQLTRKVKKDTEATDGTLPPNIATHIPVISEAVFSMVRKESMEDTLGDPMKDLNVIWGIWRHVHELPLFEQRFISEKTMT